ncbi:Divalent-cation tolerance protein CutA [Saliniradius amylolyticus]|uniref:Divalent-cation tolerance protein CutA n=1 Tax=Saliniradius amylolyticus TaxID=2183582 RepID=A0A2S2E6Y7_9ALTE|nr:divalent-cation tolerance protein CutA [Saliniradius amylolyticus]AWL13292.1 Divalent-cation tolerance protein CutA [Saliniradius amylolyticus]
MSDICVVLCTCPDKDSARLIAGEAVKQGHAACVNIIPGLESLYFWDGEVQNDSEVQMVLKTSRTSLDELFKLVISLHPYDEPEWLILDAAGGSDSYLEWIKRCTQKF